MLFINQEKIDSFKVSPKKVYIFLQVFVTVDLIQSFEVKENERRDCVGTKMFSMFYSLLTYSNNLKLIYFYQKERFFFVSLLICGKRLLMIIIINQTNDAISFAYKQRDLFH